MIDLEGGGEVVEDLFQSLLEDNLVDDGLISDSAASSKVMAFARAGSEAVQSESIVFKCDLSVPMSSLPQLLSCFDLASKKLNGLEVFTFGHIGDGNVHLNFRLPKTSSQNICFA